MKRSFSIITFSKSRLEHVKLSLPSMLEQGCREVIVVDYSCPERTGDYVEAHFPSAIVVRVEGEPGYSHWKARNAGAAAASADILVFCDADTILAPTAISWLSQNLPEGAFGGLDVKQTAHLRKTGTRLSRNELRGFHVVPSRAFRKLGGYDEVLQGYASGGDTDLADRLKMIGLKPFVVDPRIIAALVPHDDSARTAHYSDPIRVSYCAGMLYRAAKAAALKLRNQVTLPLPTRENLYQAARKAALALNPDQRTVRLSLAVETAPLGMPRQLGFEKGSRTLSIQVEIAMEEEASAPR